MQFHAPGDLLTDPYSGSTGISAQGLLPAESMGDPAGLYQFLFRIQRIIPLHYMRLQ